MYHPLNKITCLPLNKLNDLARLTLEFSLTQTLLLPEKQIHQRFVQVFVTNGYPNAGEWLWGKPVLIRGHIFNLIPIPLNEKQVLFTIYLENQNIEHCFQNGYFSPIPIPPVSQAVYNSAAELARNFYNILCDGVPGEILNENEQLDRQTVLRAYLDAQRKISLKVCPGCDGKPPSIADGMIHEDLDHFFPKSKYPFLSIHPLNLTPFCKDCNQSYKRSKDAILDDEELVTDVHSLNDIYHPYQCPAKENLRLEIQKGPGDQVSFHFISQANTPQDQARLHSLQYVLDLESRWSGDLLWERVEEKLNTLLLYGSQNERKGKFIPDQDWLNQQLGTATETFRKQQGRDCDFVPALSYVEWVISNPDVKKRLLERVQEEFNL